MKKLREINQRVDQILDQVLDQMDTMSEDAVIETVKRCVNQFLEDLERCGEEYGGQEQDSRAADTAECESLSEDNKSDR